MRATDLLFIFILLFTITPAYPGQGNIQDSTRIEIREVDQGTLDRLSADEDLLYSTENSETASLYLKLMALGAAFMRKIAELLGFGNANTVLDIIYFLSAVLFVYLIWKLWLSKYTWLFSGGPGTGKKDYSVEHEDIHALDYDQLIREALDNHDFRLAVRLLYLRTLKLLSDSELIHLQEGKTNNQYLRELKTSSIRDEFRSLSYHFNYLWYGHFQAGEHNWKAAEEEYIKIRDIVKRR